MNIGKEIIKLSDRIDNLKAENGQTHYLIFDRLENLEKPSLTSQPELKPCPFFECHTNDATLCHDSGGYHYHCTGCGSTSPSRPTEKEARKAWNNRSQ
jgi:hypothetical protein